MSVESLFSFITNLQSGVKSGRLDPTTAMTLLHKNNKSAYSDLGISLDNDMFRNGIWCSRQAKNINASEAHLKSWWEVYRPWGHRNDLIRPIDKFSALTAINEILLSLKLHDAKEAECNYDMQEYK